MISEKENKRISKFLSWALRHKPGEIGLVLDENGWADVNELIEKGRAVNIELSFDILKHIVDTNSKKRFSFNEDQKKIRANQGHSIEIDLALTPKEPPEFLFHGTAEKFVASILVAGLNKQERHHVHLSSDIKTAINVGQRHGKPVVFVIPAIEMQEEGYKFFISDNGVWLTDNVPLKFLKLLNTCIECGSEYCQHTSQMKELCPNCSHFMYGYPNCDHQFENGRCVKCYWNGNDSEYVRNLKANK